MVKRVRKKKLSMKGGGVFKEYSLDEQTALLDKISKVYVKETHDFLKDRNKSFMKFLCEINNSWFPTDKNLKAEIDKFYNSSEDEEPLKGIKSDTDDARKMVLMEVQQNEKIMFDEFIKIFNRLRCGTINQDSRG